MVDSASSEVKTLSEFLQSKSAKTIVKHGQVVSSGNAGLPSTVKPPAQRLEFVTQAPGARTFLTAVVGRSMVGALWVLRVRAAEAQPHGIAIISSKQLTMPAAGVLILE